MLINIYSLIAHPFGSQLTQKYLFATNKKILPITIYTLTHIYGFMRTDISLPEDLVKRTRLASIEKYGNSRSMSKLVEEFIIKGLEETEKQPDACSILGVRSDYSHKNEGWFNDVVVTISKQIKTINVDIDKDRYHSPYNYFEIKEAFELMLNEIADNKTNKSVKKVFMQKIVGNALKKYISNMKTINIC